MKRFHASLIWMAMNGNDWDKILREVGVKPFRFHFVKCWKTSGTMWKFSWRGFMNLNSHVQDVIPWTQTLEPRYNVFGWCIRHVTQALKICGAYKVLSSSAFFSLVKFTKSNYILKERPEQEKNLPQ